MKSVIVSIPVKIKTKLEQFRGRSAPRQTVTALAKWLPHHILYMLCQHVTPLLYLQFGPESESNYRELDRIYTMALPNIIRTAVLMLQN